VSGDNSTTSVKVPPTSIATRLLLVIVFAFRRPISAHGSTGAR
jgi:hypothetical protein